MSSLFIKLPRGRSESIALGSVLMIGPVAEPCESRPVFMRGLLLPALLRDCGREAGLRAEAAFFAIGR